MPPRPLALAPLRIAHRALCSALLLPRLFGRVLAPGVFAPRAASS